MTVAATRGTIKGSEVPSSSRKTVFVSSTYTDLAEYRRAVWGVLEEFDVAVRGMEAFGARTEAPLQTCLAEVEQSDIYVGVVAFRLGSVNEESGKSFTQLEYEHARELGKEVLIYLIDEDNARVRYADIESDPAVKDKLDAFKRTLRERHTVNSFISPEDLAEKIKRDFQSRLDPRTREADLEETELETSASVLRRLMLLPKSVSGREVRLRLRVTGAPYAAARSVCNAFRLEYGATIGIRVQIIAPVIAQASNLTDLFASGASVDRLMQLPQGAEIDVYARLAFSSEDVPRTRAAFFGTYVYVGEIDYGEEEYVAPEGRIVMLFSKWAS
ncbi:MAG: DUF4062 domain-containing protein [Chloroflexi bacterium]|nr:DUF4062 domain-containing protein [Chloroflexota bacterium]MDA1002193.1 DUF4062 domain-containing protein [Chloroflexota bacterium]